MFGSGEHAEWCRVITRCHMLFVPSNGIADPDDNQAILAIHEWRKAGSEVPSGLAVRRDPATGKHFYSSNGVKVFTGHTLFETPKDLRVPNLRASL